ncbi:hypothetical protein [Microbispora triticiradicis]|nr:MULTISPECIES: hypothetical protein [Microbispora]
MLRRAAGRTVRRTTRRTTGRTTGSPATVGVTPARIVDWARTS